MKILITGCSGMLGYDLCRVFSDCDVYGVDLKPPAPETCLKNFFELDITDFERTYGIITKINPDIVIHTAAWTDVDGAESNKNKTYALNMIGTKNIALACQRFDAAMLYISTDYVFDGTKRNPYEEYDPANPMSVYGKSKYCGELIVQQLLDRFFIVRTSWLFGRNGKNFIRTILNIAGRNERLKIVNDQFGSPTYTKDLAASIKVLVGKNSRLNTGLYGTYHITNSGFCSWYDYADYFLKLKHSKSVIEPATTAELNRPAPRPKYSVLGNLMWELSGFEQVRNWREAVKDYIGEEKL